MKTDIKDVNNILTSSVRFFSLTDVIARTFYSGKKSCLCYCHSISSQ